MSKRANNARIAITDIGGTMPEDLPTPKKSLKELEKENNKCIIEKDKELLKGE